MGWLQRSLYDTNPNNAHKGNLSNFTIDLHYLHSLIPTQHGVIPWPPYTYQQLKDTSDSSLNNSSAKAMNKKARPWSQRMGSFWMKGLVSASGTWRIIPVTLPKTNRPQAPKNSWVSNFGISKTSMGGVFSGAFAGSFREGTTPETNIFEPKKLMAGWRWVSGFQGVSFDFSGASRWVSGVLVFVVNSYMVIVFRPLRIGLRDPFQMAMNMAYEWRVNLTTY